ncbi:MAG: hypothetical protein ACI4II_08860 [Acutalibacteraceae bacterium]
MANLRKTLSLVLAIVMLVSMACVSGLSASAVAFKTVEVDTATGTYTARILVNTSAAKIGGVGCEITYPSTLTVTSATVNSAFASSSVKTDVAGTITWNAVGLVDSSADFAAITVEFTGEDGLASGFSASKFEVITSANADGSSPDYATNGDDLTLEIGRYKADDPDPTPVEITLTAEAAKTHRFEKTTIDGTEYRVLIGVMPATKPAAVIALFADTDITTVYRNDGAATAATANVRSGSYVENTSGDRVYIAVRGDTAASGACNAMSKANITNYIKATDKTTTFGQTSTILGYCKFLAAGTAFMPTKAATAVGNPNAMDKTSITAYVKAKAFTAQNISFT